MSACDFDKLLGPYHDGELNPDRAVEVLHHIRQCPECAEHVAALREMTDRLSAISFKPITPGEKLSIARAVDQAIPLLANGAILRMAIPLAALAASLLLVTSIWLAYTMNSGRPPEQAAVASADWEHVAVTLQADSRLPDWMVRSLGGDTP